MKILVTGAAGMIGQHLVRGLLNSGYTVIGVDRRPGGDARARHITADLQDKPKLQQLMQENEVDRVIHLAALAHTAAGEKPSYQTYYQANVLCAENVFQAAGDRPVLFCSTVDVFGFTEGTVSAETPPKPVTFYGKTKALAEGICRRTCPRYTIFRLSPVYTPDIRRDIQKRYYLHYPQLAYQLGDGEKFEVLQVEKAVEAMVHWCSEEPDNRIHILKDDRLLDVRTCIREEQAAGRASYVLRLPRGLVCEGLHLLRRLTGENPGTYLLHKAVHPLRTR